MRNTAYPFVVGNAQIRLPRADRLSSWRLQELETPLLITRWRLPTCPLSAGSSRLGRPLLGSTKQSVIDRPFSVLALPASRENPLSLVITPARLGLIVEVVWWVIKVQIFTKDAARVVMIG